MSADGEANTGLLDLPVGGVLETSYEFQANGKFRLSERPNPAVLDWSELDANVTLITKWTAVVYTCCTGYDTAWSKSKYTIDDQAADIEFLLKLGNDPEMVVTFDKTTKLVTFAARPEMILKSFEMSRFVIFLQVIVSAMSDYVHGN
jgi:hypothetical protein